MEVCARGVLDTVFGPECLRTVCHLDSFVVFFAGMCTGEGDVPAGVPVLGEDDMLELLRDGINEGNNLVTFIDGECAARAEVVLDVDDDQGIGGLGRDRHR